MESTIKRFILLLILISSFQAQNLEGFEFDYAQFRANSTSNLIEVYYTYDPAQFKVELKDDEQTVAQRIVFTTRNLQTDKITKVDTISNSQKLSELNRYSTLNDIIGLYKVVLEKGSYEIKIEIYDSHNPDFYYTAEERIDVKPFSSEKPIMSDLQIARSINRAREKSLFTKHTMKVIPNAAATYSSDVPSLHYYVEMYNIKNRELKLSVEIIDEDSNVVDSNVKPMNSQIDAVVEVGRVALLRYKTGIYTLQLILSDSSAEYAFATQKRFYFYNKAAIDTSESSGQSKLKLPSQFDHYSEEECDHLFELSKYIATTQEKNQYEILKEVEAKRNFMTEFWKKRNSAQEQLANSAFNEYMDRVKSANRKFKGLGKEGYKTEMGRVYITYGEPDRIEKYPNSSNLKPYEIWYYNGLEGGVVFIFGDLTGLSEYELLHSSKRGEVFDDSWQRRLLIY